MRCQQKAGADCRSRPQAEPGPRTASASLLRVQHEPHLHSQCGDRRKLEWQRSLTRHDINAAPHHAVRLEPSEDYFDVGEQCVYLVLSRLVMCPKRILRLNSQCEQKKGIRSCDQSACAKWQPFWPTIAVSGRRGAEVTITHGPFHRAMTALRWRTSKRTMVCAAVAHRARLRPGGKICGLGMSKSGTVSALSLASTPHALCGTDDRGPAADP